MPMMFDWDGVNLREVFRLLPPGRYRVWQAEPDVDLTDEEERGLMEAIASLDRGERISMEQVMKDARARLQANREDGDVDAKS